VIIAVPDVTPDMVPEATVTVLLALLHVPPLAVFASVIDDPVHTTDGPVIAVTGVTVAEATAQQPPPYTE